MTTTEKQEIIDAVISALRTNAKSIGNLTPVSQMSDTDYFELDGGRRVSYKVLAAAISSLSADDQTDLKGLIQNNVLSSVTFTASATTGTLTIKSVGKTISCTIPVATDSTSGLLTPTMKVKYDAAATNASSALTIANTAKTTADTAKTAAENAQTSVDNLAGRVGSDIATLANGKLPEGNLPWVAYSVVFYDGEIAESANFGTKVNSTDKTSADGTLYWRTATKQWVLIWYDGGTQYHSLSFSDISKYGLTQNRLYVNRSDNTVYRWNGSDLVEVGPVTQIATLRATLNSLQNYSWNALAQRPFINGCVPDLGTGNGVTLGAALQGLAAQSDFRTAIAWPGAVVTFLNTSGEWEYWQWQQKSMDRDECVENWAIESMWKRLLLDTEHTNEVKMFHGLVYGVTAQQQTSLKKSTSANCRVVYDYASQKFLLAVSSTALTKADWSLVIGAGEVVVANGTTSVKKVVRNGSVVSSDTPISSGTLVSEVEVLYYPDWADRDLFIDSDLVPYENKLYVAMASNVAYRWDGSDLVEIGRDLTTLQTIVANLQDQAKGAIFVNANEYYDTNEPLGDIITAAASLGDEFKVAGVVVTFLADEEGNWKSYQWKGNTWDASLTWDNPDAWVEYGNGGGAAIGNAYNVTAERKKANDPNVLADDSTTWDDTFESAVAYAYAQGVAAVGMQITFALSLLNGSWKNYQYIGVKVDDKTTFCDPANWLDLAGMSAGQEAIVNINELCGDIEGYTLNGDCYTQALAVNALKALCALTGLDYFKPGLIITYKIDQNKWETKQFVGTLASEADTQALWVDFGNGGGGTTIEAKDEPEERGTDAFSTGGAYDNLISDFDETIDEDEGVKIYQAVTASGKEVGNPITVPMSGGGSTTGTSLSIVFQDNPLYAAYGGDIKTAAAIRSVTMEGTDTSTNFIKTIQILDATTGVTLATSEVNQRSSASSADYSFELDFTPYFTEAASRSFNIVVTDDEGNTRKKAITVIAIDATVKVSGVQTLNYTSTTVLNEGSTSVKSIANLYQFPNNASKQGIKCVVEMLWNGEWKALDENIVTDTYVKGISINPSNVFGSGETMSHGAYPIRIQGTDVASGVKGNTVYTALMCVGKSNTAPIVVLRYNDTGGGTVRLYDTLNLEVAAYTPGATSTAVVVKLNGEEISTQTCYTSQTNSVPWQVQGMAVDGSQQLVFQVFALVGSSEVSGSYALTLTVSGSAIDATLKEGAAFAYDFASRSNDEADHTISDSGVTMAVNGANWSSNGFGTYLGENCLRIAENVTAEIPYRPFSATAESNGSAVQFAFATNNIADDDALLLHCYDPAQGVGFYVKGNEAGIYCAKGVPKSVEFRKFKCGEKITMAVVVEPSSIYRERKNDTGTSSTLYSNVKMYLNGEEVACIGYVPNSGSVTNTKYITLDGTEGDLYLYYMLAYDSYYNWSQAFRNYLCKLTDTTAMKEEYEFEDVLDTQNRPTLESLKAKGIPHYVVVADQETFDEFDGDVNTSTKFTCTLYYYHPSKPWLDFKATNVQWRRQGTTSAKRPIKNDRFYLNKPVNKANPTVVTLLHEREEFTDAAELAAYDQAKALAAINYVQVNDNSIPVQIITVKVDYSDSSNANDCGVCDLMNATFRALGSDYQTPAQRAYDGTFNKGSVSLTGLQMDHSTKNHPIAVFRATSESMTDAWFHAKGNWKEDKGEQVALGFKDTPGYNKGCLNYGDFVEYFGTSGETLDQIETRFKAESGLDTSKVYLLSQYCGRDYRFMRYSGGAWAKTTGSMKQVGGKWIVTGDVLNPVTGFELLSYEGMDWWMGVSSVDDMMAMRSDTSSWVQKLVDGGSISAKKFPAWTKYFECMVDDDQLQIDLALGKKVPYDLYRMLEFCHRAGYAQGLFTTVVDDTTGAETTTVTVTKRTDEDWKALWASDLHKYASVKSLYAYTLFTDYLAATDQRAKNMQPMWFLEDGFSVTDGVYSSDDALKMYLNKVYDCDTANGKDNDGGCTVDAECDPNKATEEGVYSNPYAGWGSVLFNNVDKVPTVTLDTTGATINLADVASTMRTAQTTRDDGRQYTPFSPDGATYHFVTSRLKFWPKVVSSYDGERKYVETVSYSDAIYFYALQGLGLTALPQFIDQRWRIRDGYYCVGGFFSGVLSGRITAASNSAKIRIKAAKTGYFGLGNDASGNHSEVVFLEEGQEHEFTNFSKENGALLYIYQTNRMSEIDLSELTIDNQFDFSVMTLVEKIVLGKSGKVNSSISNGVQMQTVKLGNLPFLKELDLTDTTATGVDASGCPRLESILAEGSALAYCSLAETSPISVLALPATMTELRFVNLPNLTYPGGLTFAGLGSVSSLMVAGCPNIDAMSLIEAITAGASSIKQIRLTGLNITASVSILSALKTSGAIGLDQNGSAYDEDGQCSGLVGRWILKELTNEETVAALQAYFPQLEIHNSQFSCVICHDDNSDPTEKFTNEDNQTGYLYGNKFVQSGHMLAIEKGTHAFKCQYNEQKGQMEGVMLSDANFGLLDHGTNADGTNTVDLYDNAGSQYDIFWHMCHCWYKGVNDFKNQRKLYFWSTTDDEPLSTASTRRIVDIADILYSDNMGVYVGNCVAGQPIDDTVIATASNCAVYRMDVEGMKQVRWPGMNHANIGCVFTDAEGNVLDTFKMAVTNTLFDFANGDYIFCDVPSGAKWFYFTSYRTVTGECHAVDSADAEAIEPDWTEHKAAGDHNGGVEAEDSLIGIYPITIDGMGLPRSISSTGVSRKGTGTSTTNANWAYDDEGNAKDTVPEGTMNYTMKDFQNLADLRGPGYQLIDYEQHKETAILWWCCRGNANEQSVVGMGAHDGKLNLWDSIGMADSAYSGNNFNSLMGLKGFIGCDSEWMDNIAVNVTSFADFLLRKGLEYSDFPIDAVAHIYDPIKKTERTVDFPVTGSVSAYNVARLKHGKHCDVFPSRLDTSDTSKYVTFFCAGFWYTASRSRAVLRSSNFANAYAGFAYANANNASSGSYTDNGARLAFRGKFVIVEPS